MLVYMLLYDNIFPEKNNTHNILSWSIKTSKLLAQKASIRPEPAHLWIWIKLAPTKNLII